MELGKIKDRLDEVLDKMEVLDPTSDEYAVLLKRADKLRKMILDEEKQRESEEMERLKNDADISERKKDRLTKIALGVGAGFIGLASIFADETRVVCRSGLEVVDKVRRIVH